MHGGLHNGPANKRVGGAKADRETGGQGRKKGFLLMIEQKGGLDLGGGFWGVKKGEEKRIIGENVIRIEKKPNFRIRNPECRKS